MKEGSEENGNEISWLKGRKVERKENGVNFRKGKKGK